MSKRKTILWGSLLLLVLILAAQPVLGQVSGRGEIRGVVRDQNQAVKVYANLVKSHGWKSIEEAEIAAKRRAKGED